MPDEEVKVDDQKTTEGLDLEKQPDEVVKAEEKPVDTAKAEPDEDKEPGGEDPQAVRARKEYRLRKTIEKQAQADREALIASEARAKTLEEAKTKEPPRYTPRQVRDAVRAGSISEDEGTRYLGKPVEDAVAEQIVEEKLQEKATQERSRTLEQTAAGEVEKFVGHLPQLRDQASEQFGQVKATYRRLLDRGMPDGIHTQVVALELTFGTLDRLNGKAKAMAEHRQNADHPDATGGTGRKGKESKPEEALSDKQRSFYTRKGWDASKDAPFAGVRNIHDLRKLRAGAGKT